MPNQPFLCAALFGLITAGIAPGCMLEDGALDEADHAPSLADELEQGDWRAPALPEEEEAEYVISRYMPVGDPNLNPNWSWTGSGAGHVLYYTNTNGTISSTTRQLPFYTGGHPLNTDEKDMYPADGWKLVYRDFGTASAAPDLPFLALYNRYRGTLRVMFFNTREFGYSQFAVELSFKETSKTGATLTFTDDDASYISNYDPAKKEVYMVEANSVNGWIWADFALAGFDPSLHSDAKYRVHIRGMNVSQVTLNSTQFTLSETLRDANPAAGNGTSLGDIVGAAKTGLRFYKSTEKAAKSLREEASKSTSGGWWRNPLRGLVGTLTNPSTLSAVAPIVGGLAGFIKSFIGGASDPSPREPLNFTGQLSLEGSITLSHPLYSIDLGLATGTGSNPPDYYRALSDIDWGIFNMQSPPSMSWRHRMCIQRVDPDCGDEIYEVKLTTPQYIINSNAGMQLQSIGFAYVFDGAPPSTYFAQSTITQYQPLSRLPDGFAVRLRFKTNSPTYYADDDIIVLKVYDL